MCAASAALARRLPKEPGLQRLNPLQPAFGFGDGQARLADDAVGMDFIAGVILGKKCLHSSEQLRRSQPHEEAGMPPFSDGAAHSVEDLDVFDTLRVVVALEIERTEI